MVMTSLGDIMRVKSGDGIAIAHLNAYGKYPVFGGNGINGYTSAFNVEAGTMIIGRVGEKCGNVNIATSRSWVSDNALMVTPKVTYDIEYVKYLLEQTNLNDFANRNAQPVISGQIIYAIEVPYVSDVDEQKSIGQIVRFFDDHIANLTELIEKKKAIRDAALEDILSGGTRLVGFSGEWEEYSFDDFFTLLPNNTLSREKLSERGTIGNIHYGDVLIKYHNNVTDKDEIPRIKADIDTRSFRLLQVFVDIGLVAVVEVIFGPYLTTERFTVLDLLYILKTTSDSTVSVTVEGIERKRHTCIDAGVDFAGFTDRLTIDIDNTGGGIAVGIYEPVTCVSFIVGALYIAVTKRGLQCCERRHGLAGTLELTFALFISCLNSCLDFLDGSRI